jgi:tetratricopeptide (TPR) repeat protein
MTHIAAIPSGGYRESFIGELIVGLLPIVDHFIFVDSGESAQEAIRIGVEMAGTDKSTVVKYDCGGDFDCATARNICLDSARDIGADWVSIWDTDERVVADPEYVSQLLITTDSDVVMISDVDLRYKKAKFFRVPAKGRWSGIVHEAYCDTCPSSVDPRIRFSEVPKSAGEHTDRMRMIENKCRKAIELEPGQARWHYYLGDSLSANGKFDEAVDQFLHAAILSGWQEEVDWSYYQAATIRERQGRRTDALALCKTSGLRIPETAWLAALVAHRDGQHEMAIYYSQLAAELAEKQRGTERIGFSDRFAWYEGPHDVARFAYRALKREDKFAIEDALVYEMESLRKIHSAA